MVRKYLYNALGIFNLLCFFSLSIAIKLVSNFARFFSNILFEQIRVCMRHEHSEDDLCDNMQRTAWQFDYFECVNFPK